MRHLTPLHYIDAIVRAGSIRKAAETLAITSTALNRRVLALEEELGLEAMIRRFAIFLAVERSDLAPLRSVQ